MQRVPERPSDRLAVETEQLAGAVVHGEDRARVVDDDDGLRQQVERLPRGHVGDPASSVPALLRRAML